VSRLSVTIIAWNEEERLRACLESVAWADEIVVVDAESGDAVIELLFQLNREAGTTLIMVTHDEQLAKRCTRVVRLAAGRIVA